MLSRAGLMFEMTGRPEYSFKVEGYLEDIATDGARREENGMSRSG